MAFVCLRLETLSASGQSLQQTQGLGRQELDNRASRFLGHYNLDLLMPQITPEMTDDDLLMVVNSRTYLPSKLAMSPRVDAMPACAQSQSGLRTPSVRCT